MADVVRVEGTLRGMRAEARCTILAWKESSSTGRLFTRGKIAEAPSDLPDGTYMLTFGEHSIWTRKWEGHWLLRYLPQNIEVGQAA